jgi:mediator of replication checkpoint protein 1
MSTPSTPYREGAVVTGDSPSPSLELTPRSKVKALLLAFDSDDESPKKTPGVSLDAPENAPVLPTAPKMAVSEDEISNASDSESDTVPTNPVGRTVARMMAKNTVRTAGILSEDVGDAYSRVKMQILRNPSKDAGSEGSQKAPPLPYSISSEDDMPVQKLKKRQIARRLSNRSSSAARTSPSQSIRHASPGLFVSSRSQSPASAADQSESSGLTGSDSDAILQKTKSKRKRARTKRRAFDKAEEDSTSPGRHTVAEKLAREVADLEDIISPENDDVDLTQQSRPTRKAGKKALEEMNRETQRIARNQYLAHHAKVKRKYTTKDFLKRFNFGQNREEKVTLATHTDDEYMMTSAALASSDIETNQAKDTPPTSPPSHSHGSVGDFKTTPAVEPLADMSPCPGAENDELPTLGELIANPSQHVEQIENGKGRAVESAPLTTAANQAKKAIVAGKFKVIPPQPILSTRADSDDDLEIVPAKPKVSALFDNLDGKNVRGSNKFHALRHLANLTSPGKKSGPNKNHAELTLDLREKARLQALKNKEERLNELRAKGVHIRTQEEREQDQLAIVNALENARQDDRALAKKEKDAAKKNGETGEADALESSDDEEWVEEVEQELDVELSGSEDEEELSDDDADADDEDEEEAGNDANPFLNNEAEDESAEEDEQMTDAQLPKSLVEEDDEDFEEALPSKVQKSLRLPRKRNVVLDDDDEDEDSPHADGQSEQLAQLESPGDKAMAAFGFQAPKETEFSLTQVFAGTMAASGTQGEMQMIDTQQDSLAFLRELPLGTAPDFSTPRLDNTRLIQDSQVNGFQESMRSLASQQINLGLSQFPSHFADNSPSKMSDFPEPTQDVGFVVSRAPIGKQDAPPSTVDTIIMGMDESPIVKKKGRLMRGKKEVAVLSEDEAEADSSRETEDEQGFDPSKDAFDILFKGAKKSAAPASAFDKKKSEAKGLVAEQAEESEDEYAGLGGASDDESVGEVDEEIKQMIDEGHVEVDERKLAAFFADKERQDDEKRINKLYKDVTTGMLRRKRGADLDDLDDPDDEAAERRRRKQEEFARMRKALREDEKIGKLGKTYRKIGYTRCANITN